MMGNNYSQFPYEPVEVRVELLHVFTILSVHKNITTVAFFFSQFQQHDFIFLVTHTKVHCFFQSQTQTKRCYNTLFIIQTTPKKHIQYKSDYVSVCI